ncbi:MAG: T9SS type A sorting domain-containing protein [Flavobacteriia bacterium]
MKTILTAVVLMVAMNAVSQEDQHLEGQVKDKEMNGIDKISELVAGSVLAVEVYPNPSDGNVFVTGKAGSTVTLYSLSGTYVGTWIINAEEKVAITDLPEGSYLCSLNNNGTKVVKRFVVL